MRLRVIDCDGSVAHQPFLAAADGDVDAIDARDLAAKLRIVASRSALRRLDERLVDVKSDMPTLFFLGSGDFHHLAYALLRRIGQRVTVIHFDNHPDWVRFPGSLNCGSWINKAIGLDHVSRVVTVGPCSSDLAMPEFKTANLSAIRAGALEVYAWRAEATQLWGAAIEGPGVRTEGRRLIWRNLADESWPDFLGELCDRLPSYPLWISIDKDVLCDDEAVTNWDQGAMSLSHITEAIETLADHRPIVGVDICGDYSLPRFSDPFRAFLAATDRPRKRPDLYEAATLNSAANQRLVAAFQRVI